MTLFERFRRVYIFHSTNLRTVYDVVPEDTPAEETPTSIISQMRVVHPDARAILLSIDGDVHKHTLLHGKAGV
jgi:hypothetical protein